MSYGDLIVRELGLSQDVFRLSDPLVATADYGVSSDAISAYGAKLLGLPGTDTNAISSGAFSFRVATPRSCATSSKRCCPRRSPAPARSATCSMRRSTSALSTARSTPAFA